MSLRIAVPSMTDEGLESPISAHFGHSPTFTLIELEGTMVLTVDVVENPYLQNHRPGVIPNFLAELGTQAVITQNAGERARQIFNSYGIDICIGYNGTVDEVVKAFQRNQGANMEGTSFCSGGGNCDSHE